MKRGFIFTDKSFSAVSILSSVLGGLSVFSELAALNASYRNDGVPELRLGVAVFLCLIYALGGMSTAIYARLEKDRFYFFANLGIVLNALGLLGIALFVSLAFR